MRNIGEEIRAEIEDCKKELKVAYESLEECMKREDYRNMSYYGHRIAEMSAKLSELEYLERKLE